MNYTKELHTRFVRRVHSLEAQEDSSYFMIVCIDSKFLKWVNFWTDIVVDYELILNLF